MHPVYRRLAIRSLPLAALAAACLTACADPGPGEARPAVKPATLQPIPGTDVQKVILSADAARRIGIQTAPVAAAPNGAPGPDQIPLAAVYYDGAGATWTYTNPQPLVYVRQQVVLGPVTGDTAVLQSGPAVGTQVVTVGEPELYGVEYGVGGEQ